MQENGGKSTVHSNLFTILRWILLTSIIIVTIFYSYTLLAKNNQQINFATTPNPAKSDVNFISPKKTYSLKYPAGWYEFLYTDSTQSDAGNFSTSPHALDIPSKISEEGQVIIQTRFLKEQMPKQVACGNGTTENCLKPYEMLGKYRIRRATSSNVLGGAKLVFIEHPQGGYLYLSLETSEGEEEFEKIVNSVELLDYK